MYIKAAVSTIFCCLSSTTKTYTTTSTFGINTPPKSPSLVPETTARVCHITKLFHSKIMAFLGNLFMKPRAMLTAVHTFLEDEATLIMPLSLPTQENQAVKKYIP